MKRVTSATLTLIAAACILPAMAGRARAATVVAPGETDHFAISAPSGVRAGEPFSVELQARDFYDNVIAGYDRKEREVELTAVGTGKLDPQVIKSDQFKDGKATVTCTYTRAEIFKIIAREKGSAALGSVIIQAFPGKATGFEVLVPACGARAGEPFTVEIIARDAEGNCVSSFGAGKDRIRVSGDNGGTVGPDYFNQGDFAEGIAMVSVSCTKAGKATLTIKDENADISGQASIGIQPGYAQRFTVTTPAEIVAGRAFQAEITAYDAYDNVCIAYDKEGKGAYIKTSGTGVIKPTFIPAFSFQNGTAAISFIYTKAEPITIAAQESPEASTPQKSAVTAIPQPTAAKPAAPKPVVEQPRPPAPAQIRVPTREEQIADLKKKVDTLIDAAEYERALETTNEILKLDPADKDAARLKERLEQVIRILQ